MRLFIAAQIEKENKKTIHEIQKEYRAQSVKGTFTRIENYHLTLKFLGETEKELIPKIIFVMDRAVEETASFGFTSGNAGCFSRKEGFTLFLGVDNGADDLWKLSALLEEELFKSGFKKETRIFTPHITLGRRIKFKSDFNIIAEEISLPKMIFNCTSISLMESFMEKGILCYNPLYSAKLKEKPA
ncbi:MAG: RNA 2',3'-cyclic phosphodiesterase [Spirochaetes bacterium]|nr:RNA 2',3'-cyclic phosphodiesterase [Spirochaetota bacterium]